jgi:hypothetical protein
VVGWTAVKQMAFTPEDAELESAGVRSRNLGRCLPRQGFSLCVPIMGERSPLGVILIGPSARHLPHAREIGRTIALLSSVAIASTVVLRKERQLAETDGLTGLLNKTNVHRRLRSSVRTCSRRRGLPARHHHFNTTIRGHLPGDLLKRLRTARTAGRTAGRLLAGKSS